MPKLENTINPFVFGDAELLTEYVRKVRDAAPPFGSPESLAELERAYQDGLRFQALLSLPTDTQPH